VTIDQVRRLYDAQPFRPFTMRLADGREFAVRHREFVALAPSGRTLILYQPDVSFGIVDMVFVAHLEIKSELNSDNI
jgi:hypothetical protein